MKVSIRKALFILTICLASAFFVPSYVHADGTYGDFKYAINDSTKEITITGYTGVESVVIIPAKINGYYVTSVSTNAFKDNKDIVSICFEDGSKFRSIPMYAFKGCSNLKSFEIIYHT